METAITLAINSEGLEVNAVYIGEVRIPQQFEAAVTAKVIKQQNAATVLMTRNVTMIDSDTTVIVAQAEADVQVKLGVARNAARVVVEQAKATALQKVLRAEAEGFQAIATELSLSVDQVLAFKKSRMIRELGSAGEILVVGFADEHLSVKERA